MDLGQTVDLWRPMPTTCHQTPVVPNRIEDQCLKSTNIHKHCSLLRSHRQGLSRFEKYPVTSIMQWKQMKTNRIAWINSCWGKKVSPDTVLHTWKREKSMSITSHSLAHCMTLVCGKILHCTILRTINEILIAWLMAAISSQLFCSLCFGVPLDPLATVGRTWPRPDPSVRITFLFEGSARNFQQGRLGRTRCKFHRRLLQVLRPHLHNTIRTIKTYGL